MLKMTPKQKVLVEYPKAICLPVCSASDGDIVRYGVFLKADTHGSPDFVGKTPRSAWKMAKKGLKA